MLGSRTPRAEVQAALGTAHDTAVEIGASPLASRMAALARRARIELRAPADVEEASTAEASTGPAAEEDAYAADALRRRGLSNREIEVLTLVAAGYSNKEIGDRLFISAKTASVHVTHILDKLDVSTRTEAATIGVRLGLPEVDAVDSHREDGSASP